MKKKFMKFSALVCAVMLLLPGAIAPTFVLAEDEEADLTLEVTSVEVVEEDEVDEVVELIEVVTSDEEEELEVSDITDEELLEAEPDEIPEAEEDSELTESLLGYMLLDVEGNGEVYYIDPVTGGKEYLADGESAQLLLRRRALGINEENFAKLTLGEEKEDESVCEESDLGKRLRGRIVLRTEENGEAYWILPTNCRAYYAGTFEASYELMKKFSLGITKKNLAKVPNNQRQKMKNALRLSVYAHAEDNDMTLKEAREDLEDEVESIKTCMEAYREADEEKPTAETNKERVTTCVDSSGMPVIDKDRREEIKETIKETRQERMESIKAGERKTLGGIDFKRIIERVKTMINNRIDSNPQE